MLPERKKYACLSGQNCIIDEENLSKELKSFDVLVKVYACGLSSLNPNLTLSCSFIDGGRQPLGTSICGSVLNIGAEVKTLAVGDNVAGVIPLSYSQSGCAEYLIVENYDLIRVPDTVNLLDVSACLEDCLRTYIALFYCSKITKEETILIISNNLPFASMFIQVAQHFDIKVLASCTTLDEKQYLQNLNRFLGIIDLTNTDNIPCALYDECMKKTENLGVDVVLDLQSQVKKDDWFKFSSEAIISCLTIHGRWITTNSKLQLDPPDSESLFERCASVSFLNEQAWLISKIAQGKYQHILLDVIIKLQKKVFWPPCYHIIEFMSLPNEYSQIVKNSTDRFVVKLT